MVLRLCRTRRLHFSAQPSRFSGQLRGNNSALPLLFNELDFSMPESAALLYMPVTLHHAFLEGQRVSQLAYRGAQRLQRKLVWFYSGWLEDNLDAFDPPMD